MKYDTLLFSRTLREDYHWIHRPYYIDESINELLRPLFMMIESSRNRKFFLETGLNNFYFFLAEKYCVLCYLYFTKDTDLTGRRIYALEGICCRRSSCHRQKYQFMWEMLPELILLMYESGQGFRWYLPDESRAQKLLPSEIDICRRYKWEQREYNGSISNLRDDIRQEQRMYSFVFGTEERSFYKLNLDKYYQVNEARRPSAKPQGAEVEFFGADPCKVKFYFGKERDVYTLSALAFDERGNVIYRHSDAVRFSKEGIGLNQIYRVLETIEKTVANYGYVVKVKFPRKREEKRALDLEIEEKTRLEAGGFVVQRISCVLQKADGRAEEFQTEEDRVLSLIFSYTRRLIKEAYYSFDAGKKTIYILNLEQGLWMFYIERDEETSYCLRGIRVAEESGSESRCAAEKWGSESRCAAEKWGSESALYEGNAWGNVASKPVNAEADYRRKAWLCRKELLEKYLLCEEVQYEKEELSSQKQTYLNFLEAYEKFLTETELDLQMQSAVITHLPDGNFPKLLNLKVYTVSGENVLFISKNAPKKREENRKPVGTNAEKKKSGGQSAKDTSEYRIVPPALGWGKWHLEANPMYAKGRAGKAAVLTSVVRGSCGAEMLLKEVGELLGR